MLRSGLDKYAVRLNHNHFAKSDDFPETTRVGENSGMGCYSDNPAQDLRRDAVARVTVDDSV